MTQSLQSATQRGTQPFNLAWAILALAMGGVGIGVTEFTMMGLLTEVEKGLGITTPEAGHLISAYALGVVVGAPLLAAVGARLPRKHLALGLMLVFTIANLSSYFAPDYGTMLVFPVSSPASRMARSSASPLSSAPRSWPPAVAAGQFPW